MEEERYWQIKLQFVTIQLIKAESFGILCIDCIEPKIPTVTHSWNLDKSDLKWFFWGGKIRFDILVGLEPIIGNFNRLLVQLFWNSIWRRFIDIHCTHESKYICYFILDLSTANTQNVLLGEEEE